jgi:hypothetical protein
METADIGYQQAQDSPEANSRHSVDSASDQSSENARLQSDTSSSGSAGRPRRPFRLFLDASSTKATPVVSPASERFQLHGSSLTLRGDACVMEGGFAAGEQSDQTPRDRTATDDIIEIMSGDDRDEAHFPETHSESGNMKVELDPGVVEATAREFKSIPTYKQRQEKNHRAKSTTHGFERRRSRKRRYQKQRAICRATANMSITLAL